METCMPFCFYHRADFDGICSGAILKYFYPDIKLVSVDHSDGLSAFDIINNHSIEENDFVYMVDFSLQPFEEMEKLSKQCKLVWIDHHVGVIRDCENSNNFTPYDSVLSSLDKNMKPKNAACDLVWTYLSDQSLPYGIYLLSRYDIWDLSPDGKNTVLEFQYGMRNHIVDVDSYRIWALIFHDDSEFIHKTIADGKKILNYESIQNKKYINAFGYAIDFCGYKAYAVNKGLASSLLFNSIEDTKYDLFIAYVRTKNGKWKFSLYSKTLDVSTIAKQYGGGGHKGAAGFEVDSIPQGF